MTQLLPKPTPQFFSVSPIMSNSVLRTKHTNEEHKTDKKYRIFTIQTIQPVGSLTAARFA